MASPPEIVETKARELLGHFQKISRRIKAIDAASLERIPAAIGMPEMRVLEVLADHPHCIMRELAGHLHSAVSTVTGIVDKLVQKDLVRRERVDDDRRIVRVELSETGHAASLAAMEMHLRFCRELLAGLDNDDERETFLALMGKIARHSDAEATLEGGSRWK